MTRFAQFAVALVLFGCPKDPSPTPHANVEVAPRPNSGPPAPATAPAPASPEPDETGENETTGVDTGSDDEATAPSRPTAIKRRRCKRGFSPCYGGRECCNDLFEVCARDNHCHPLE